MSSLASPVHDTPPLHSCQCKVKAYFIMILAARHAAETAAASTSCPQRADDLSPLLMTCNAAEAQTTASTSPLRTTGTATAQRNASKSPLRTTSNTTADQAPEDIAAGVLPSAQSAGPRQQQQQQQQQQKHQPGGCKPEGTASDAPPTAHCSPRQQQQSEKTATAVMGSQEAEEEASPPATAVTVPAVLFHPVQSQESVSELLQLSVSEASKALCT